MNKYINQVLSILSKDRASGVEVLDSGTMLIGRAPHIAKNARIHLVFSPITNEELETLKEALECEIPLVYEEFLQIMNGLSVFHGDMSLDGYRKNYNRIGSDIWQPFNIVTANTLERPRDAASQLFFIGGYTEDGSRLYIDTATGKVYRSIGQRTSEPKQEWPDFWTMLVSEVGRLSEMFDENGVRKERN